MKELIDIDLKSLIENETGEKFNREGYIKCPFHNEKTPSLSIKFFPDRNKYKFMCWGCKEQGDAIDFISKFKGMDYKSAREYLEMENKKSIKELLVEKVKSYIDWQLGHNKAGYELLGIFPFTDAKNEYIYFKAKFKKPDGSKETPYYHIEDDKVVNNRGTDEVPYNLYNVLEGIKNQKVIVFVEGEKDSNTINSILRGKEYVATSIKGCKELQILQNGLKFKIYVIGDTGKAGEDYKWDVYSKFKDSATEFKFINLPGLKALGDNKDVTDWLDSGHTPKDLLYAFDRSLDLKSKYDLQQNRKGIYKWWYNKKIDEHEKQYLTDFKLLEAKRLRYVEEDQEGIRIKIKTPTGDIIEREDKSTVFDDIRTFKHFLGTMDASFLSKNIEDLTLLKRWINKYWAVENSEIYSGTKFIEKNNNIIFITNNGAITPNGIDHSITSSGCSINIIDKELIGLDELKELKKRIFRFWDATKSIPIIGTIINNLATYHNEVTGGKLHILLIVGESQSGKSTILERVIIPILNYPIDDKNSMATSPFAIQKDLASGNYTTIYDEFKPSMMDQYKVKKLSGIFRDIYDRQSVNRGDKSFQIKKFRLTRPLVMAGEEGYPHQESASVSRSCIVYLSRRERTQENTEAMEWLIDNSEILNKFGRSIINEVLNMSIDQYKEIRKSKREYFKMLKERPLDTAINISCGIEIFNILLERYGLKKIINYEKYIYKNIKEEILDGGTETKSIIEQMIILYNMMIEDGKANDVKDVVKETGEGLYIRTSEMINQIFLFCKQYESADLIPLKLKDFKKQAQKAGYITKNSAKNFKIEGKSVKYDEYSKERMRGLNVDSIVEPDRLTEVPLSPEEGKIINGMFQGA
ncbi:CHC2 zinc finger domain-containing protein [Clostridium beijerinckii]|uniref:CHC2 zinc finger domain-containing protein n=1 Tax=Clostridium beijerinckii TaxID=1520 RepID=UPI00232C5CE5|nr:CHC2 zinc finger domain-containing protein [Clostridium beijerinckii]